MASASPKAASYITITKTKEPLNVLDELNPVHNVAVLFHFSIILLYF